MESQEEDLYIVVGAHSATGAHYREVLSRQTKNVCLGLGRSSRPGNVCWDTRDKNLLWVDLCRTYDDQLRQALKSFIDSRDAPPTRITVIFAAGRNGDKANTPPISSDRRRSSEMRCFDALALKNIVSMMEEIIEAQAVKLQKPTSLRVAALSDIETPKAILEAFVRKFVSAHDRNAHPYLTKSGLILRTDITGMTPSEQVAQTLPHILSMPEGESALVNIPRSPEPAPSWQALPKSTGFPDDTQWRGLFCNKDGIPRSLWSSIIKTRRAREASRTGVMPG